MSQSVISDSEDEYQPFSPEDFSQERLRTALQQRKEVDNQLAVRETHTLGNFFRDLIEVAIGRLSEKEDAVEEESHQDTVPLPTSASQPTDPLAVSDPGPTGAFIEREEPAIPIEHNRPLRRRNISFLQQHIYTIDYVAYRLQITQEEATSIVQGNPKLIDYYHNGTLIEFLTTGRVPKPKPTSPPPVNSKKSPTSTLKSGPKLKHRPKVHIQEESQEMEPEQNLLPSNESNDNDSYSDPENSSIGTDSDSLKDDDEEEEEDSEIEFRGRKYKGIDGLSRGAKLPKSFFELNKPTMMMVQPQKKRPRIEADRIGLAKKKKNKGSLLSHFGADLDSEFDDSMFIVDEGVREQEKDIVEKLLVGSTPPSVLFDHDYPHTEEAVEENPDFHFTGERSLANPFQNYDWEVQEDNSSGFNHMLASRSSGKTRGSRSKRLKSSNRSSNMVNSNKQTAKIYGVSEEKAKRLKRSFNGSIKSKSFSLPTPRTLSRATRRATVNSYPQPFVAGSRQIYTKSHNSKRINQIQQLDLQIQRQRQRDIYDFTVDGEYNNGMVGFHESSVFTGPIQVPTPSSSIDDNYTNAQKMKVKARANFKTPYSLPPDSTSVLPRPAATSTIVDEGLSHRYAIVPKKKTNSTPSSGVIEEESYPDLPHDGFDQFDGAGKTLALRSKFTNSVPFKRLFTSEKMKERGDVRVVIGSKVFLFSSLNVSFEENIVTLFELLLDRSAIKNMTPPALVDSLINVAEVCACIEVSEARSLIVILDKFKIDIDFDVKKRGRLLDTHLLYLSFCYIFYYCCYKILQDNYLEKQFNFREKASDVTGLFFHYVSFMTSEIWEKISQDNLYLSESFSMLFLTEKDITWTAIDNSDINDLNFLKQFCTLYQPDAPLWKTVKRALRSHLDNEKWSDIKVDFQEIHSFVSVLKWKLDEDVLVMMFECLKKKRFHNFRFESTNPVIFTVEHGINMDTSLNIYLNLLLNYGRTMQKPSARLLDKIIPLSKSESMDSILFANRINIIIVLSYVFKKSLISRAMEILHTAQTARMIRYAFIALRQLILVNHQNNLPIRVTGLKDMIKVIIDNSLINDWKFFIKSIKFETLNLKTQESLISELAPFKNNPEFMKTCFDTIRDFTVNDPDGSKITFFKDTFGDLSPSIDEDLWLLVSGKLVTHKKDNWSRLIYTFSSFNQFKGEVKILNGILDHSGMLYFDDKNTFIYALMKGLVLRVPNTDFPSFMRRIGKYDPQLMAGVSYFGNDRLTQLTRIITNLLKNESMTYASMFISGLIEVVKSEYQASKAGSAFSCHPPSQYKSFCRSVVEYINQYAFQLIGSASSFIYLCQELGIARKTSSLEESQIVNIGGNIKESLESLEVRILNSLATGSEISKVYIPILLKHTSKKMGLSTSLEDSKLYTFCCSISVHITLLEILPSCWIILQSLTDCFIEILKRERNLSRIDIFCLLKTIALFPFILSHRSFSHKYQDDEVLTITNIYQILHKMVFVLNGTNDYEMFLKLAAPFLSRHVLHERYETQQIPKYLVRNPSERIKQMITNASMVSIAQEYGSQYLRKSLDKEFDKFIEEVDSYQEDLTNEPYSDHLYL